MFGADLINCKNIVLASFFIFLFISPFTLAASDPAFDQCINDIGEANGWTEPSEYGKLECPDAGISNVSELSEFTEVGLVNLSGNNISSIDVTSNSRIFHLNVTDNSLGSLNISGNPNLSVLLASGNNLTGLDTGSNSGLAVLSLGRNNISSLDFSNNPNLIRVFLHNNNLSTLDISSSQGIYELTVGNNNLTSINMGPSGSLQTLGLANNQLTSLDITGHGALSYLNVVGNPLDTETADLIIAIAESIVEQGGEFTLLIDAEAGSEQIDIADPNFDQCLSDTADANGWSRAEDFTSLDCSNAGISEVGELFHLVNLGFLNLAGNNITDIDVSANTALFNLNVNENGLSTLDISTNTNLSVLQAGKNHLTALDTDSNSALVVLNVGQNAIEELNFSNNANLGRAFVQNNNLTTLDISNNSGLSELVAGNNSLTSITLGTGGLETLGLLNNQLTSVDITGHGLLNYVNVQGNPLDSETIEQLTAIAEEAGEDFTLLIDVIRESVAPPEEPVPAATKINSVGPKRNANIGLGAYSDSGAPVYGNSFNSEDFITLYGSITPDPIDVGVDGFFYVALLAVTGSGANFSFVNEDGNFEDWDTTIPGLAPFKVVEPLEENHDFRIFEGNLQAGKYKILIAYSSPNTPLVWMKPIKVTVTE